MKKQQEIAPLHADFNCFREQPSPGLTHTECDMLWPSLICSQVVQMGDKGDPKQGLCSEEATIQHIEGLTAAGSAWAHGSPHCPALPAAEGEQAQPHSLLQSRLSSYRHRGDAGRAALQLPPVTHLPSGEAWNAKEKDPGNHKPQLTN